MGPDGLQTASSSQTPLPLRTRLGLLISAAGALVLASMVWKQLQTNPAALNALLGGSMAALATALGALPVLLSQHPSERTQDTLFGFGAGVMLAACAFSLILPGLEAAKAATSPASSEWMSGALIGTAILLGGAALLAMERLLPHEHFIKGREGADARQLRRTWLFVIAITLHNLPEGLAIGVGYAANEGLRASSLTLGIAIQDVPEGFVVAASLLAAGYTRGFAVVLGALTGLIEPLGAVIGAIVVSSSSVLLPWGLGFAAGAMLFVISHEIIPESHRKGHEAWATTGLMLGFVVMMILDTSLGG
ncbi:MULTISPECIES: ZIP family metal transporter [Comamonas]|uniref:Membrane protein n=1 Tax=Comamonas testosteroni TaxID=285 RepID=A0A096FPH2_COMTE|nr:MULTISPECIES: ZIP family metal transporter [Comamonas]KGH31653.1 membrane protein [Comamonas testosteroni]MPT13128.1 ZIP family metal transporter [Comamonas sp.]